MSICWGSDNFLNPYGCCSLFKKYCYYNLWLGSSDEFLSLKHCENYAQHYISFLTYKILLNKLDSHLILKLYQCPKFIKFIKFGFIRYLNRSFLVSFYTSCLFSHNCTKKEIEIFFISYFHKHLIGEFRQDLFLCVEKSLTNRVPKVFKKHTCQNLRHFLKNGKGINASYVKSKPTFYRSKSCVNFDTVPIKVKFDKQTTKKSSTPHLNLTSFLTNDKYFFSANHLDNKWVYSISKGKFSYCFPIEVNRSQQLINFFVYNIQQLIECLEDLENFDVDENNIGWFKENTVDLNNKLQVKFSVAPFKNKNWGLIVNKIDKQFDRCPHKQKLILKN